MDCEPGTESETAVLTYVDWDYSWTLDSEPWHFLEVGVAEDGD